MALTHLLLQMLRGDIKDGDSVIIDVGSDGEITVVRLALVLLLQSVHVYAGPSSPHVCCLSYCCSQS